MRNLAVDAETLTSYNEGSADAASAVTIAASETQVWVLELVIVTFDGNPASELNITINAVEKIAIDLTTVGPHTFTFGEGRANPGLHGRKNQAIVVTATAPGSGVSANVFVKYR